MGRIGHFRDKLNVTKIIVLLIANNDSLTPDRYVLSSDLDEKKRGSVFVLD